MKKKSLKRKNFPKGNLRRQSMRTEHSLWQDGETAPRNKHIKWANILRIIS